MNQPLWSPFFRRPSCLLLHWWKFPLDPSPRGLFRLEVRVRQRHGVNLMESGTLGEKLSMETCFMFLSCCFGGRNLWISIFSCDFNICSSIFIYFPWKVSDFHGICPIFPYRDFNMCSSRYFYHRYFQLFSIITIYTCFYRSLRWLLMIVMETCVFW